MVRYQYLEMTLTVYASGTSPNDKTNIYQLYGSHPKSLLELKDPLSGLFGSQPGFIDEHSLSWSIPDSALSFPTMRVFRVILDAGWKPFDFDTQARRFRRKVGK